MTSATALQPKRSLFGRIVVFCLEKFGSRHIKRIIFFGSLFPYALQLETLQRDVMKKLNRHYGLATNARSLLFPGVFRNLVWGERGLDDTITPADIREDISDERAELIARKVVDRTPSCIVYDTVEKMVKDVKEMFVNGDKLVIN
ncbi:MAG TPA: hypothetical protein VN081_02515 [Dongiaceae bacterium]|nr:hypothetical protein [Dongiaceae bacterium]